VGGVIDFVAVALFPLVSSLNLYTIRLQVLHMAFLL